jgi:hypothetical protein
LRSGSVVAGAQQKAKAPVIERRYLSQPSACTEAIELLLKKRGRLLDKSGPDDAKEIQNVSRHKQHTR